ncbi:GNAT family N-acetyltransferase [Nodosilinea sp. LEGE 06152]|uniref:GNAT family N-acetyltransferase n=1 Tax=Nodosilinea sp. LEGE 06152 TaxID=2777966 RepID=UPI00187F2499|nr:GNAT family N-acetyltransferase [Nodosilinea sp. LEGE 06152]MBE9158524.1 GNAT family N-acetyltransferase [Nodosilinea sp. LEGE 06152]
MITRRPELKTERLLLRLGTPNDIPAILEYYQLNRAYLEPFEPQRPANFYTHEFWQPVLASRESDFRNGFAVKLLMFLQAEPKPLIGTINLNTIVRGALYGATLGYSLSAQYQGQGYMTEAGQRLITYAFGELNLHRIMANYLPHNHRSANVLKRLGFQIEGIARDYLFINGQWQDHVMTSLVNPHWQLPDL